MRTINGRPISLPLYIGILASSTFFDVDDMHDLQIPAVMHDPVLFGHGTQVPPSLPCG